jgi:hypothetical protein
LHGRAQGICNAQHRVFPPASGHLSSVIGDLFLSSEEAASQLIVMAHEYQIKADPLEAHAGSSLASIPYNSSQDREA